MSTATVTETSGKAETRAAARGSELPETMRALVCYGPGDYRLGSNYPTDCDYDPAIGRPSITLG